MNNCTVVGIRLRLYPENLSGCKTIRPVKLSVFDWSGNADRFWNSGYRAFVVALPR